ncbi:glycoside hydrolase family 15 [Prosthecochloris sp. GSB1]|nr:glycoside hydrolase family 15 [Prosthecochloris sp. GSB1]
MFRDISDYGIIGNMRTAALVSTDGSIDYCSMPFLDSPTIFAALLDDEKGGYFSIRPKPLFCARQEYLPDTNILACTFTTAGGEAMLFDFMPVETEHLVTVEQHRIHRCLTVRSGRIEFLLTFSPRPDYALITPHLSLEPKAITVSGNEHQLRLVHSLGDYRVLENEGGTATLSFTLEAEQNARFNMVYGKSAERPDVICDLQKNIDYWKDWLHGCLGDKCRLPGEHRETINRSLLALKLLTFSPTGAIAAAPTTSLPESIGGERNWDYRFTWLRDASFTLKAFFSLGYIMEADSFIRWLHAVYRRHGGENLRIMYSLEGESLLREKELEHLKGYRNSRPVRIGNLAHTQNQWDIYGEIMDTALRLSDYAGKIDEELWPFFRDVCALAMKNWKKPDDGIWEVRNGPYHFVYSKVMCWVALDRGIAIAKRYGFEAPVQRWIEERSAIREDILAKGYDPKKNTFVQRYGSRDLDASLLLLPLVDFLPFEDERIQGTIDACRKELMHGNFLRRYLNKDGLEGEEGGFILCNFWLVECLACSGRLREAEELLLETMRSTNHLGLFSEEFDAQRNMMLGNFPQAFSHIGCINAVTAIQNERQRRPVEKPDPSLVERLRKLIPLQTTLNEGTTAASGTDRNTGARLKSLLGALQGAFFDTSAGRVDYETMKHSRSFAEYLEIASSLRTFDPASLESDDARKAFWINIYNILIIHGVIEFDIRSSVLEIVNFFGRIVYEIGGLPYSPDDIEHGILRGNRPHPAFLLKPFGAFDKRRRFMVETFDPRIHFALVCASSSCPPIEFYDERHIDRQLDIAARSFINRRGLEIDRERQTVRLSEIFKWYERDFGRDKTEVVGYLLRYLDGDTAGYLRENTHKLIIDYLPYNWNLNSTLE